jgi:hypothetical protein
MPKNAEYSINLNKDVAVKARCSDCKNGLVQVHNEHRLQSFDQYGEAMIHLESVNPTGDYHLQSVIVGDVHSIHVDKSYSVLNIPLGSSYDL